MKRAIVVGSSGYAGRELCGLLAGHAGIDLWASMSARSTHSWRSERCAQCFTLPRNTEELIRMTKSLKLAALALGVSCAMPALAVDLTAVSFGGANKAARTGGVGRRCWRVLRVPGARGSTRRSGSMSS